MLQKLKRGPQHRKLLQGKPPLWKLRPLKALLKRLAFRDHSRTSAIAIPAAEV